MRPSLRALALVAGLLSAAPAMAAPPNAAETKMIATIRTEHERHVQLLEKLVRVNSGSMNLKGVEEVGRLMRAEFEPLGFEVRWIPMTETGRAGHLVATHKGNGRGKRLLLIGHLDTVFEPDSPFQGWTRRGGTVEGPGVGDMKGGLVIIVSALRAMQTAGTLKDADITVVLTGDEEKPGSPIALARRDLIAAGRASDVALDFEGLSQEAGQDIGSIARRSSNSWTLRVEAKSGHSSGVCSPSMGCGANYELARILEAFRTELPEPNLTFNVGMMAGGAKAQANEGETGVSAIGKTNIISGEAVALGDIRTLSNEQEARVRAKMQAIVERPLPHAKATLQFDDTGYPPMAPTEGNKALLRKLNEVNATLGLPQMPQGDPARRGAGDIAFVSFVDGLVGMGMAGEGSHAPGETADLTSLERQAQRAALLMSRLAKEPRGKR
ncbi:M20/M25/M40 family metallo-hydrolase [Phenylobacterium sp.]|jgi:glutamate carboxypeptidase|uniref:M20/M25/M40 family metallo-hydrolase n=1 Tax=Phenylobacterium sp. TaxID=1871053 RepID=UPI002F95193C